MGVGEYTYPVLLFMPVVGLANANTEAFVADGLIGALLDGLTFEVSVVASHLRCHWRDSELVLSCNLRVTRLATERSNGKLESISGRLGDSLLSFKLLIVPLVCLHLQQRSQ